MRVDWADYCNKFYHVDAYKETYAPEMKLLIGRENWNKPRVVINPPIDMRKPGRPTKKGKRALDEVYTERKQRTCRRYKNTRHNIRTCKGAEVGSNQEKKRQRTIVVGGSHNTSYPDSIELSTSWMISRIGI
ncbi:hypothetical protein MKX01_005351 [Papaver californicum]|nr:hypothetical protein MKX01_005351 [Papaver californicum]